MKNIKDTAAFTVIRSQKQYNEYLSRIDELMTDDPAPNSKEGIALETLSILVEDYERKKGWEIPVPDNPVELIKNRMAELDLKQVDLAEVLGDKTVVSRILNGTRKLTYGMIRPLSELLRVPPEFLLEK